VRTGGGGIGRRFYVFYSGQVCLGPYVGGNAGRRRRRGRRRGSRRRRSRRRSRRSRRHDGSAVRRSWTRTRVKVDGVKRRFV